MLFPLLLLVIFIALPFLALLSSEISSVLVQNRSLKIAHLLLAERYPAPASTPSFSWVEVRHLDVIPPGFSRTCRVNRQRMATGTAGLFFRTTQGKDVCIPWENINLVNSSKFGFFKAEFTISGLADGRQIGLKLQTTDQKVGSFLEQCVRHANGENVA